MKNNRIGLETFKQQEYIKLKQEVTSFCEKIMFLHKSRFLYKRLESDNVNGTGSECEFWRALKRVEDEGLWLKD